MNSRAHDARAGAAMLKNATLIVAAVLVGLLAGSGCTAQALCEKSQECAEDPPGEDFVRICQVRYDGQVNAYRANEEEECHILADRKLAFDACRVQLSCSDFRESGGRDYDGDCEDEHDDYFDALDDVEQECGTLD